MKRTLAPFLVALLMIGTAAPLAAHAFLQKAEPPVGSTVEKSPDKVSIQFTEQIEPVFSKIQVFNAAGREVDKRDVHVDSSDRARLEVSLPSLSPGTYKVVWRVVSVDTHVTSGNFSFTVTR